LRNILCQPVSGFFNKYSPSEPSWLSSVLTTICLDGEYPQASVLECWCTSPSVSVCVYVNTSRLQDHSVSLVYITFSLGVCVYVNTSRLQDHSVSLVYSTSPSVSVCVCVREHLTSPGLWQQCMAVSPLHPCPGNETIRDCSVSGAYLNRFLECLQSIFIQGMKPSWIACVSGACPC